MMYRFKLTTKGKIYDTTSWVPDDEPMYPKVRKDFIFEEKFDCLSDDEAIAKAHELSQKWLEEAKARYEDKTGEIIFRELSCTRVIPLD